MRWDERNSRPLTIWWRYGGPWRWWALGLVGLGFAVAPFSRWLSGVLWLTGLGLIAFFRNPKRSSPDTPGILSPADGRVVEIQPIAYCPSLGQPATQIGIFLSVFDVHVIRSPITGQICAKKFIAGHFRPANFSNAGATNQRCEILLEDARGQRLFFRLVAGAIARRVIFSPTTGDILLRGAITGMIRFGSRVEIRIPHESKYMVACAMGDRVVAGKTVLATEKTST